MDRKHVDARNQVASEHYLRGEFAKARSIWTEVLRLDPGDEQALEGVRLTDGLSQDPPTPPETLSDLLPDLDLQEQEMEIGDLLAPETETLSDPNPAEDELRRRSKELLLEAREHAAAGRREEALSALHRLLVLDEDNADARAIEEVLRVSSVPSPGDRTEMWIAEAVQAMEQGRSDEARELLRSALEASPGHREVLHYLEKLGDASSTCASMDEVGRAPRKALEPGTEPISTPQAPETLPLALRPEPPPPATGQPVASGPEVARALFSGRRRRPSRRLVTWAMILGAIGLLGPWIVFKAVRAFFGGAPEPVVVVQESSPEPAKSRAPDGLPAGSESLTTPEARARMDREVATARATMRAGNYASAVVAWNAVLSLDPTHEEAGRELREAGDLYKKQRADEEQIEQLRRAFEDGEYSAALRILYRLPPAAAGERTDRWIVNGWYNLGLVSLKAGDCRQALSHFDEALSLQPRDEDVAAARAVARAFLEAPKDRSFYDRAESLPFRGIDD